MKKTLLTVLLAGVITISCATIANAAGVTFTKPSIQVNTSQEKAALSKKVKELEDKQTQLKKDIEAKQEEAKAQQAAKEKEAQAKKEQREKAVKTLKNDTNNAINNFKNAIK